MLSPLKARFSGACVNKLCRHLKGFRLEQAQNRKLGTWPREITLKNARQFVDQFDTFILDCDGVIWHVDHCNKFDRVQIALNKLKERGKTILFASNNSIPSGRGLIDKIKDMTGYHCSPSDNYSVNCVIRYHLGKILKENDAVYLMGSSGLEEELTDFGVNHFGNGPDSTTPSYDLADISAIPLRDDVKAILVGQDEHFNFMKLVKASSYLRKNPECHFLATSWETGYEFEPGRVQPIAGSLAQCVAACAGREPTYLGKPGSFIFEIMEETVPYFDKTRTCMVGDSLKSDVGFARYNGIASLAVLSGVTSLETMKCYQNDDSHSHFGMPYRTLLPDYFVTSVVDLADMLD